MKILPIKPMSNYDKLQNLINLSKHAHAHKAPYANKYGVSVEVDSKHFEKGHMWDNMITKYKPAIKEIISKLKRNHG